MSELNHGGAGKGDKDRTRDAKAFRTNYNLIAFPKTTSGFAPRGLGRHVKRYPNNQ